MTRSRSLKESGLSLCAPRIVEIGIDGKRDVGLRPRLIVTLALRSTIAFCTSTAAIFRVSLNGHAPFLVG
jgi:hypothetical protein